MSPKKLEGTFSNLLIHHMQEVLTFVSDRQTNPFTFRSDGMVRKMLLIHFAEYMNILDLALNMTKFLLCPEGTRKVVGLEKNSPLFSCCVGL